ncbi:hypothetical protein BGX38DRAFT_1148418 [Terfezia claveryi]|nr:hypothetical protein BGX38DRAFT_1148418 [Terfezia claveryi]
MMPKRQESRHKKTPLEQARLAALNFNFQTVNSLKLTPAITEKHKQVGLETFGFISQPAKSRINTIEPECEAEAKPKPLQRKRRKVVLRPPRVSSSVSASSRTSSLSPPTPSIDTHDSEIAETQFAQPDPKFEDEPDSTTEERQAEMNPPAVSFPSPILVTLKPGPLQMLPPQTTPKQRKVLEIPSSHSPPVTPISPYRSPSVFRSSQKSPSHRRPPLQFPRKSPSKWSKSGLVASSQWWDNEELGFTQEFTQGLTQGRVSLETGEEDEDEDDFFNQTFHAGRLFQTDRARGSFSPLEETQAATYRTSPQFKAEGGLDTPHIPLFDEWEDSHQQRAVENMIPESPQLKAKKIANTGNALKIKTELQEEEGEIFPQSTQTQNRWEVQHRYPKGTIIPESPLSPFHESRKKVHWEGSDRTRATSTFPQPSPGTLGARNVPEETQYGDVTQVQYEWWDILSAAGGGAGEGRQASNGEETGIQEDQTMKKVAIAKKEERKLGYEEKVPRGDDVMPTLSQLLPATLMESFPMPPPLTQWSSQLNWTPGGDDNDDDDDDDDDEL